MILFSKQIIAEAVQDVKAFGTFLECRTCLSGVRTVPSHVNWHPWTNEPSKAGPKATITSSEAAERRSMDRNLSGFLIGCVGAAVTLLAYEQTLVSSTQCVAAGFVVLLFALFVKEGFISL
ncbi:hypothetical protein ABZP36_002750 [Zizania latifolia]